MLKLADRNESSATAAHYAEFGEDMLVEEIAADAKRHGGFGWGERKAPIGSR